MVGLRSGIAALLVVALLRWRGEPLRLTPGGWRAGLLVGALFAFEYLLVAQALLLTHASHVVVFLYTAPIFAALGLHARLPAERLHWSQWLGIGIAFFGIAVAFLGRGASAGAAHLDGAVLLGDALALLAGVSWGATTVTIRCTVLARVPATESQGRIHTSTTGVLVFPEVDEPEEVVIQPNDLKIDVYRSSGPGGQSVNTTDSAVRITHLPTGIVVSMQNEKSQLQNREAGMRVLRARILARQQEELDAASSAARKSQIRGMDRSERIRTYNFPENRIADHRTGYKAYNLDQVMDGALDPVIASCIAADEEERLAALGEQQ